MPAPGKVDWAGVGDAYFAMVAVPATPSQGVEYQASKYEFPMEPYHDSIFQWVIAQRENKRDAASDHGLSADRDGRFGNEGLHGHERLFRF